MLHGLLSVLLSVLYPGLGHSYQGRTVAGYVWIVIHTVGLATIALTFGFFPFIALATWALGVLDTLRTAGRASRVPEGSRNRRFMHLGLGVGLIVLSLVAAYTLIIQMLFGGPGLFNQHPEEAEALALRTLEERYEEPFVIKESSTDNNCAGCEWRYSLLVTPADDPELEFYATVSQEMEYVGDEYLFTRWNAELDDVFIPSLEAYGLREGTIAYDVYLRFDEEDVAGLQGDVSYTQIAKERPELFEYDIDLHRIGNTDDPAFLEAEWNRLRNLHADYQKAGQDTLDFLIIHYYNEDVPVEAGQVYEWDSRPDGFYDLIHPYSPLFLHISSEDFAKLKSAKDFRSRLETYRQ